MTPYASLADDFYINMNLNTEMTLPAQRETILGFFERIQKKYPTMRNFHTRETGDFVLEEDKDVGRQRWVTMESRRVCSCQFNPDDTDSAFDQHSFVLQLVPYMLSVSPLDCEALDYVMGFDFVYRGNHDEIVSEALGVSSGLEGLIEIPGMKILNFEPTITIALDESCRRQARLMIETRTNAYQVRRGEFPEEQISVFFTVRQYGSLESETSYEQTLGQLRSTAESLLEQYVVEQVLRPLQQAIAAR